MRAKDRHLGAWFAIALFPRGLRAPTIVGYIAGFALIGFAILIGVKFTQDLYRDSAEAYAWGRQFLWGYGRHPPLTGWIAGLWYRVFPAADWASYLLSRVLVFVSPTSIYFLARRTLDPRRAALIAAALTIYSAAIGLLAIAIAALLHADRLRFFGSPAPYVAAAVFLILISPHVIWLVERDFPTFRWAQRFTNAGVDYWESINYLRHHASLIAIPLLAGGMALVPWRLRPAGEAFVPKAGGLILAIASVLVFAPPLLAIPLHINLKRETALRSWP